VSIIIHNDNDPFCDCPSCTAELEAMLQSSLINRDIAQRAARNLRIERLEADIEELRREVAQLKERLGE
jgi:polyhydroxyalkanoate synthesis regulator phasin